MSISNSVYHIRERGNFSDRKKYFYIRDDNRDYYKLIKQGGAKDFADAKDLVAEMDTLYVSANGNVIFGCDWSYETIDKYRLGNIKDQVTLDKLLRIFTPSVIKGDLHSDDILRESSFKYEDLDNIQRQFEERSPEDFLLWLNEKF